MEMEWAAGSVLDLEAGTGTVKWLSAGGSASTSCTDCKYSLQCNDLSDVMIAAEQLCKPIQ